MKHRKRSVGWRRASIYRGEAQRRRPRLSVDSTSRPLPRVRIIVATKLGSPDGAGSYKRLTR